MLHPDIKRLRLGVQNPAVEHPYGMQRLWHGFGKMMRQEHRFSCVLNPVPAQPDRMVEFCNVFLENIDALHVQSPRTESELYICTLAREMGLPVWLDFGDDIFSLDPSHPVFQAYADEETIRKNVTRMMEVATVTSVATDTMRDNWPLNERVIVLPDECRIEAKKMPRKKVISWRGMSSHAEDIESILPQLLSVAADPLFADWRFLLMGDPPWKLWQNLATACNEDWKIVNTGQGKRVMLVPYRPTVLELYDIWSGFCPYIHLVPLSDSKFNKGKSPNAWLEATGIGAAVIAPDFLSEWDLPGMLRYSAGSLEFNGKQTFETVLRSAMTQWEKHELQPTPEKEFQERGKFHPSVELSRAKVYPDWTTEGVNKKRWAILNKLMAKPHEFKARQKDVKVTLELIQQAKEMGERIAANESK